MSEELVQQPKLPATTTSPLSEVDPASLNELFARDPMDLTNQDLDKIIAALRAQRLKWKQDEASGGAKKAAKIANAAETKKISVDDLDIDL